MGWFAPSGDEEQKKRRKIRAYFEPDKGIGALGYGGIGTLLLSLFALLAWFGVPVLVTVLGVAAATVPFGIAWVKLQQRLQGASDEDIDIWRDQDFDSVIERVCAEGDYETGEPIDPDHLIVIIGFVRFENLALRRAHDNGNARAWAFKVRVGEDGITRYTPPSLTILHITTDHLIAHSCDVDLLTGRTLNESVSEYFWQDIVTLQIDKQLVSWADEDPALVRQWAMNLPKERRKKFAALWNDDGAAPSSPRTTLRLKTNTGSGLEIVMGDARFAEYFDEEGSRHGIAWRNREATNRLRAILRERKALRR